MRIAFLYSCRYSAIESLQRFSINLTRLAAAKGKPGLYHETITWALLLLIRERVARAGRDQSWNEFAAANPDLMNWKENILKTYYTDAALASDFARSTFIFPDRIPPRS